MKSEKVCVWCRKPASDVERNRDGTYLHSTCASEQAASFGWNVPAHLLPSTRKKEADDA